MKKVIISVIIAILLLSSVTVVVMYKMGEKFLEEVMLSDIGELDDLDTGMTETERIEGKVDENTEVNDSNIGISQNNDNSGYKSKDGIVENDSLSVENIEKSKKAKKVLTIEKVEEIKETLTFTDKMTAARLVAKRLSLDDINKLKGLIEGGLSQEEKKQAKQIAYDNFTSEEIKEIKKIYYKYTK